MEDLEFILPKMGESVNEATVTEWLVEEGQIVKQDDILVRVATDKVDTDVVCQHSGILSKILVQKDEVAQVGEALANIQVENGKDSVANNEETLLQEEIPYTEKVEEKIKDNIQNGGESQAQEVKTDTNQPFITIDIEKNKAEETSQTKRYLSPLVRNIAKSENISLEELYKIKGSGKDNRLLKDDLLSYVDKKKTGVIIEKDEPLLLDTLPQEKVAINSSQSEPKTKDIQGTIIPMDYQRKVISKNVVESKKNIPHTTIFVEVDVSRIVSWRNKQKEHFIEKEGHKLTFTPIFFSLIAKTVREFTLLNSSLEDNNIHIHEDINIGMATALPNNNLIVPVIRNADKLSITGMSHKVNVLTEKARNNLLQIDDLQKGTFTVSNIGSFGGLMGTPIIQMNQCAVLAVGTISKKAIIKETPQGDEFAVGQMMILSLSIDHRIIDGALAGQFLNKLKEKMETWEE